MPVAVARRLSPADCRPLLVAVACRLLIVARRLYRVSTANVFHPPMCFTRHCVSPATVFHPPMCFNRQCVSTATVFHPPLCFNRQCVSTATTCLTHQRCQPLCLASLSSTGPLLLSTHLSSACRYYDTTLLRSTCSLAFALLFCHVVLFYLTYFLFVFFPTSRSWGFP
jgi:hypothetical protein